MTKILNEIPALSTVTGFKNYSTAVKRVDRVDQIIDGIKPIFVIHVRHSRSGGLEYVPVAILSDHNSHWARTIAENGVFCTLAW